jgi:hypothetical protein
MEKTKNFLFSLFLILFLLSISELLTLKCNFATLIFANNHIKNMIIWKS